MFSILKKVHMLLMFQNITHCEKQVILLMIPNEKEWNYLAVKKLSPSLTGITSKDHGDLLSEFSSFF